MAVLLVCVISHHMSDFMIVISVELLPVTYVEGRSAPAEQWLDVGVTKLLDTSPLPIARLLFYI